MLHVQTGLGAKPLPLDLSAMEKCFRRLSALPGFFTGKSSLGSSANKRKSHFLAIFFLCLSGEPEKVGPADVKSRQSTGLPALIKYSDIVFYTDNQGALRVQIPSMKILDDCVCSSLFYFPNLALETDCQEHSPTLSRNER